MENMSDVINSLNPHLICEIGEEVKLHEKEIGKLEKMLVNMENVNMLICRKTKTKPTKR